MHQDSCAVCEAVWFPTRIVLPRTQERDPRAYQLALQLPGGCAFVASTPEQLYVRNGAAVASEAVAGTRPRGSAGAAAFE